MAAPNVLQEQVWSASGQLQTAADMIGTPTNATGYQQHGMGWRPPVFKTGTLGNNTGLSSAEIATATGLPAAVVTDLITRVYANPRGL